MKNENKIMLKKATLDDIDLINETYDEHFKYEKTTAYTIFKREVFPAKETAEKNSEIRFPAFCEEPDFLFNSYFLNSRPAACVISVNCTYFYIVHLFRCAFKCCLVQFYCKGFCTFKLAV